MKSAGILPLAILLAATPVFGQNFQSSAPVDSSSCPVRLQMEHSNGLFVYQNAKADPSEDATPKAEQRFDFSVTNLLPREIVSAEITVHGFSYKSRTVPATTPTPDLWKTMHVALDVKGNSRASREVSFHHFSAVGSIDLNALTYADGTTWHASSSKSCSVAPSLMMRISTE